MEPYTFLGALLLADVVRLEFWPDGGEQQEWLFAPDGSWACHNTLTDSRAVRPPEAVGRMGSHSRRLAPRGTIAAFRVPADCFARRPMVGADR